MVEKNPAKPSPSPTPQKTPRRGMTVKDAMLAALKEAADGTAVETKIIDPGLSRGYKPGQVEAKIYKTDMDGRDFGSAERSHDGSETFELGHDTRTTPSPEQKDENRDKTIANEAKERLRIIQTSSNNIHTAAEALPAGITTIPDGEIYYDVRLLSLQQLSRKFPQIFEKRLEDVGLNPIYVVQKHNNQEPSPPPLTSLEEPYTHIKTTYKDGYRIDTYLVSTTDASAVKTSLKKTLGEDMLVLRGQGDIYAHQTKHGISIFGQDHDKTLLHGIGAKYEGMSFTDTKAIPKKQADSETIYLPKPYLYPEELDTHEARDILTVELKAKTDYSPSGYRAIVEFFEQIAVPTSTTEIDGLRFTMIVNPETAIAQATVALNFIAAIEQEGTFEARASMQREKIKGHYEKDGVFAATLPSPLPCRKANTLIATAAIQSRITDKRDTASAGIVINPIADTLEELYEISPGERRSILETMLLDDRELVGRNEDITELLELLEKAPGERLESLIISGPGGAGKSTVMTKIFEILKKKGIPTIFVSAKGTNDLGEFEDLIIGYNTFLDTVNFNSPEILRMLPAELQKDPERVKSTLRNRSTKMRTLTKSLRPSIEADTEAEKGTIASLEQLNLKFLEFISIYAIQKGIRVPLVLDDAALTGPKAAGPMGEIIEKIQNDPKYRGLMIVGVGRDQLQIDNLTHESQRKYLHILHKNPTYQKNISPFLLSHYDKEKDRFIPNEVLYPAISINLTRDKDYQTYEAEIDDSVIEVLDEVSIKGDQATDDHHILAFNMRETLDFLWERSDSLLTIETKSGGGILIRAKAEAKKAIREAIKENSLESVRIYGIQTVRAIMEAGIKAEAFFHILHYFKGIPEEALMEAHEAYGMEKSKLENLLSELRRKDIIETGPTIAINHHFYQEGFDRLHNKLAPEIRLEYAEKALSALTNLPKSIEINSLTLYRITREIHNLKTQLEEPTESDPRKPFALGAGQEALSQADYATAFECSNLLFEPLQNKFKNTGGRLSLEEFQLMTSCAPILATAYTHFEKHQEALTTLKWLITPSALAQPPQVYSHEKRIAVAEAYLEAIINSKAKTLSERLEGWEEKATIYKKAISEACRVQTSITAVPMADPELQSIMQIYIELILERHKECQLRFYRIHESSNKQSNYLTDCIGATRKTLDKCENLKQRITSAIATQQKLAATNPTMQMQDRIKILNNWLEKTTTLISRIRRLETDTASKVFQEQTSPGGKGSAYLANFFPNQAIRVSTPALEVLRTAAIAAQQAEFGKHIRVPANIAEATVSLLEAEAFDPRTALTEFPERIRTAIALAGDCPNRLRIYQLWRLWSLTYNLLNIHPVLRQETKESQLLYNRIMIIATGLNDTLCSELPDSKAIQYNGSLLNIRKALYLLEDDDQNLQKEGIRLFHRTFRSFEEISQNYQKLGQTEGKAFSEFSLLLGEVIAMFVHAKKCYPELLTEVENREGKLNLRRIIPPNLRIDQLDVLEKEITNLGQLINADTPVSYNPIDNAIPGHITSQERSEHLDYRAFIIGNTNTAIAGGLNSRNIGFLGMITNLRTAKSLLFQSL